MQEPAAALLFDCVVPVANSGLGDLSDQGLRVAQHQQQQLAMAVKFFFHPHPGKSIGITGALDQRAARRALAAQKQTDAEQALVDLIATAVA